jgi:hypothetical protein
VRCGQAKIASEALYERAARASRRCRERYLSSAQRCERDDGASMRRIDDLFAAISPVNRARSRR